MGRPLGLASPRNDAGILEPVLSQMTRLLSGTSAGYLMPARLAVFVAFFNLGAAVGLWAVFIPVVRDRLGVSEGVLGLVLFSLAAGAIIAMPATGWAIARFGSHALAAIAAVILPLCAALPILSPTLPLLFAAAFILGAAAGTLDVSMNNEAARIDMTTGRTFMSTFHGLYSVGGLTGAGLGALILGLADGAVWYATGILTFMAIAAMLVRGWYLPPGPKIMRRAKLRLPSGPLIALGAMAFLCFGLEGAVLDWSALFLVSDKGATPSTAAAGYAAFAGAMAVMRFAGDRLVVRVGRFRALLLGGLVITLGGSAALLAPNPILSAVGFGLVGIGAANIVPVLLSSAAGHPPGSGGVAAVSTIGYLGILTWPPVIGLIAERSGLPTALWLIALAGAAIALGARIVRATPPR